MGTKKWLKLEMFPNFYRCVLLSRSIKIGRSPDNDIVLSEISVSAHHATVWDQGDEVWVKDEGSTNGTMVNGVVIKGDRQIGDCDCIGIGYARLYLSTAQESDPRMLVDLTGSPEISDKNSLLSYDDIVFVFPPTVESTDNIRIFFAAKLTKILPPAVAEKFSGSVAGIMEEIRTQSKEGGVIKCRFQKLATRVNIIIAGEKRAYVDLSQVFTPEKISGASAMLQDIDEIEWDEKQNVATLVKYLDESLAKKRTIAKGPGKYCVYRYFPTMVNPGSFALDIAIADEKIATLPDYPEGSGNKRIQGFHPRCENPDSIQIVPIFPGCLCAPCCGETNLTGPSRAQFWLTPLTIGPARGLLQLVKNGRVCHSIEVPYSVKAHTWSNRFLAMALWIPVLIVVMSVLELPIKDNMPLVILQLVVLVESMGGLVNVAVFFGLISLVTGILLRTRPKISNLMYEILEV